MQKKLMNATFATTMTSVGIGLVALFFIAAQADSATAPLVSMQPPLCPPRLVAEIDTAPGPRGVALDVAGRRAFVAHANGVTVIDITSLAVIAEIPSLDPAHGIAYDADRGRIWVTYMDADRVTVLGGATFATLADVPAGDGPHSVAYNPANGRVYVTNYWDWTVNVYDAGSLAYVTRLTDFTEPAHLAVNPVTNKIYVANHWPNGLVTVIDGATHSSRRIRVGLIDAYGVAVDTRRNLVYVTAIAQGRISIIDGATDTQLDTVDIRRSDGSPMPLRVISVNPDAGANGYLFFVSSSADGGQNQFLLIPDGWPVLGTPVALDIASYPLEGIAFDPVDNRVWVTSVGSGLVSVVRVDCVPTGPADFSTSYKTGPLFAEQGDVITYTIVALNTGGPVPGVILTDTLPQTSVFIPGSCTYRREAGAPQPCDAPPGRMWQQDFGGGGRIITTFAVRVTAGTMRWPLVNCAYLSWDSNQRQLCFTTTVNPFKLYLPLVMRN